MKSEGGFHSQHYEGLRTLGGLAGTKDIVASRTTSLESTIKPPRNIPGVILACKDLHWSIFDIAFEAILVKREEL